MGIIECTLDNTHTIYQVNMHMNIATCQIKLKLK